MRHRQFCALARAAELLGERWTLLIVRELLLGPRRFRDLRQGLGGVSTSVLASRLARMERTGLVRRAELAPPAGSAVYELTEHGTALRPAIFGLIRWGGRFLLPPRAGESFDPRWLPLALGACARKRGAPLCSVQVFAVAPKGSVAVHIQGGRDGTQVKEGTRDADLTIRGDGRTILGLLTGTVDPADAAVASQVQVEGNRKLLRRVPALFDTSGHESREAS